MKLRLLLVLVLVLVLDSGCYSARQFPLQPGDKIIFTSADRANEYRLLSGNNPDPTNRVVEITRPCSITAE